MLLAALVALRAGGRRSHWSAAIAAGDAILLGAAVLLARELFHFSRLCAWLLFLYLPFQLLAVGLLPRPARRMTPVLALLAVGLWTVAVDAFLIEPRWLEVTTIELASPRVAEPTRVVVLADLQTDRIGHYERAVSARLRALEPDLLLLTGDYLQLDGEARRRQTPGFRSLFQDLDPALGAFAVRGNVDAEGWDGLFEGTPVIPLAQTQSRHVSPWLTMTGLGLRDSFDVALRLPRPGAGFHVVFGHGPDFSLGEVEADLLVAGHTHGGQVRLPLIGPLVTFSAIPRSQAAGISELSGGRTLVVSRGVGMERGSAPRLRFLCRPQLVVIDLVPGGRATAVDDEPEQ
ncbi:MAG TPA: metallophosphoesterase [Thermoanaerobaculia bacterium]|nr:metallophosphoesterase [Thermoanaerobaculia bacterium]